MGSAESCSTLLVNGTDIAWSLSSFLGGISPLGEAAIFLAKKTKPAIELLEPDHYRNCCKRIADDIIELEPRDAVRRPNLTDRGSDVFVEPVSCVCVKPIPLP